MAQNAVAKPLTGAKQTGHVPLLLKQLHSFCLFPGSVQSPGYTVPVEALLILEPGQLKDLPGLKMLPMSAFSGCCLLWR